MQSPKRGHLGQLPEGHSIEKSLFRFGFPSFFSFGDRLLPAPLLCDERARKRGGITIAYEPFEREDICQKVLNFSNVWEPMPETRSQMLLQRCGQTSNNLWKALTCKLFQ